MKMYDVAITGGGASGLYLAALLGGRLSAVVIESGARVGSKLSATGGGQGNLTNTGVCADRYFCSDRRLVESVAGSDWRSVLAPFDGLFTADARGRVYPAGRQASALTDCLRRKAEANADIMTETSVLGIKRAADGFLLKTDKGAVRARNAVLCTGGMDTRTVFSGHTGYDLATSLGHSVTALYPAITQLALTDKSLRALKGVRTDCRVRAYGCGEFIAETEGEVIFGDGVVGGSAVYYISSFVTDKRNVKLEFEFLPGVSEEEIAEDVRRKTALGVERGELLGITLNNRLGRAVVARTDGGAEEIAHTVKHFTVGIAGAKGFYGAQVTKGGIPLSEVTDGLESRFVKGLYFAGEILDVDGECGGFNLHWAFSSAARVARSLTGGAK